MTREELRDLRDDLVERMTAGFSGVHQRLDQLNGRTGKSEALLAASDVRLTNLEREVFPSSRRQRDRKDDVRDEDRPALTRREAQLLWTALAAIAGLVLTLAKLAHELWVMP